MPVKVAQIAMRGGGKQLILDTVFGALLTTKSKQPPANAYMSYSFGESCSTAYIFFLLLPVGVYQNHFELEYMV